MSHFELLTFSESSLYDCLSNRYAPASAIALCKQPKYLFRYIEHLKGKFIVVEPEYIDGDYLEDFASYYVSCFERYDSHCKRLHFFSSKLNLKEFQRAFERFIVDPKSRGSQLKGSYLGFVVVRPLPEAVVGRTLLKTYPWKKDRDYPAVRKYRVSLFGRRLGIETLPYQQQDTVIAACATVALWSAFHKTNELFNTPNPRPARITNAANTVRAIGRALPSHDLNTGQMCEAVRAVGLEPQMEEVGDETPLLSIIYGHLRYGIPPILLVSLELKGEWVDHALTVTGYSIGNGNPKVAEKPLRHVHSVASRIEEIYVHDDNVGPFSRLFLERMPVPPKGCPRAPFAFRGKDPDGKPETLFVPTSVLLPVYPKIRVTFSEMHSWPQRLMRLLVSYGLPSDTLEWDIHLVDTAEAMAIYVAGEYQGYRTRLFFESPIKMRNGFEPATTLVMLLGRPMYAASIQDVPATLPPHQAITAHLERYRGTEWK